MVTNGEDKNNHVACKHFAKNIRSRELRQDNPLGSSGLLLLLEIALKLNSEMRAEIAFARATMESIEFRLEKREQVWI